VLILLHTLRYFICPLCHGNILLEAISEKERDQIKEASLICSIKKHRFPVVRFIPRFVSADATSSSFGFEWNTYPRTQLDSANGMRLSEERFFRQTQWPRDLAGQKILEVGSGAGRFSEIALQTGAQVFSIDASQAVDANWSNNGHHPNLILCQASLYELPFAQDYFDKVFCFGVLQHTPDVRMAFAAIARFTRPGGELVVDVYNKDYWRNYHTPIYLIRAITKHIPHGKLYQRISWSVPYLLPISTWLRNHIPFIGRQLGALIPVANYQGLLPTDSQKLIEEYSCLDTFDTLSPKYISPQRPETLLQWFLDAGYEDIEFDRETTCTVRGRRRATDRSGDRSEQVKLTDQLLKA
jgi:2-polyprenyl-3-methyl-5-hydroxy-6-metoxy-1,4-benzoquinol methylase